MDVDMSKPKANKFGDFGDMNSILGKIDTKLDKQMKHDARIKQ
jgi:hypothetical protein